jgi:hypothetical protein
MMKMDGTEKGEGFVSIGFNPGRNNRYIKKIVIET